MFCLIFEQVCLEGKIQDSNANEGNIEEMKKQHSEAATRHASTEATSVSTGISVR